MTETVDRDVRQDVADVLVRYATGIDRRDWDAVPRPASPRTARPTTASIGVWHGADEITEWMRDARTSPAATRCTASPTSW